MAAIWLRPWAGFGAGRHRHPLAADQTLRLGPFDAPLFVNAPSHAPVVLSLKNGRLRESGAVRLPQNAPPRRVDALSLPVRPAEGLVLKQGANGVRLVWPHAPDKPPKGLEPHTPDEERQVAAMNRVERVRARMRDLRAALDDPLGLWTETSSRWRKAENDETPDSDIIVRHAREMAPVIEALARHPRRVLRREAGWTPLARVQEMDRAAMLWLARQPGRTLAERAGPSQRIQAPVRVESIDTLENRVLRSLAELSRDRAHDYCRRNAAAARSPRRERVERYGRACGRIARDLAHDGVRTAPHDAAPNYVLQNDPGYHSAWEAWGALLRREAERDELWRWQARAWEEFCGVALVIALERIPGARLVAASPVAWREEQDAGCWLDHDNPLAVFFIEGRDLIVEVQMRSARSGRREDLLAPVWLRVGDLSNEIASRVAVWPLHGFGDAADPQDADEVMGVLRAVRLSPGFHVGGVLRGGVVIRPTDADPEAHGRNDGQLRTLSCTLGPSGKPLARGLDILSAFVIGLLGMRDR